jgi:YidC/Oxa1 family membrane protein insertase
LNYIHFPYAFGFSLVALTVLVRLALQPFFYQQVKMSKQMEALKPRLDELSKKHKDDAKKMSEEQMKLYKEMKVNPASGCLIALVQMPIFIALYNVMQVFLLKGQGPEIIAQINKVVYFSFMRISTLDTHLFIYNLALVPNQYQKIGWYYLLIPLITAALQYFSVSMATPAPKKDPSASEGKVQKVGEKPNEQEDMQKAMATQMKVIFPLMIGWFSFTLPVGLSLYWNIFSIFTILQYKNIFGLGVKIDKK